MEALKQKILQEGSVRLPDVIKVDSFLNHQIDTAFLDEIGREFYVLFGGENITKIVTIEASGIAIGCAAARHFGVPVVFAKKHENKNMDEDVYQVTIHSFTKNTDYVAKIARRFLDPSDRVLIIDDFLANGEAASGLVRMVRSSGAEVAGVGIVIEKSFQNGGQKLRDQGIRVESLAVIEKIKEDEVIFKD